MNSEDLENIRSGTDIEIYDTQSKPSGQLQNSVSSSHSLNENSDFGEQEISETPTNRKFDSTKIVANYARPIVRRQSSFHLGTSFIQHHNPEKDMETPTSKKGSSLLGKLRGKSFKKTQKMHPAKIDFENSEQHSSQIDPFKSLSFIIVSKK